MSKINRKMLDGGQQQFALYGPCKAKNKIRISWKVKDYPHHRDTAKINS